MPVTPSMRERLVTLTVLYAILLAMLAAGAGWPAVVWCGIALPLGFYLGWAIRTD